MTRTVVAQTVDEIARLAPLWQRLERRPAMTIFQSHLWNLTAARILRGFEPYVVAVENGNGAAIIPGAVHRPSGTLTLLGGPLFDYRDVLSDDAESLAAAWRVFTALDLPFRMTALRAGSPQPCWNGAALEDFTRAPGVSAAEVDAEVFAYRHPRADRQMRRLKRKGATLMRCNGSHSGLIRWIYQQKNEQLAGDPLNVFADRACVDFMLEITAADPARCEVFYYQDGNQILSALLTFCDQEIDSHGAARPIRRYYTTCFDRRWERFSPGMTVLYEVARRSLQEGLDCDLMTGEQFHKVRLATHSVPLYRVSASAADLAVSCLERPVHLAA